MWPMSRQFNVCGWIIVVDAVVGSCQAVGVPPFRGRPPTPAISGSVSPSSTNSSPRSLIIWSTMPCMPRFTHSLARSLTHSPSHLLNVSLTHSLTILLTQSITRSIMYSLSQSITVIYLGAIHLWRPQKNHVFDPPLPPVLMRPHGPDPLPPLWTSKHGLHKIHTALLKWLVQWPTGPKGEIRLYDSNLFKLYF